jgi:TRAP-type mannitol/chloroaromatic compound transport system permease large subunit
MSPWTYPGFFSVGDALVVAAPAEGPSGRNVGTSIWGDIGKGTFKYYAGAFNLNNVQDRPLLSVRLAYAVIVVGAVLGAITGTVAASVIAMGVIALPIMMRYGYDMKTATGVIAASGTITQLIPPSLVLVVLADQIGRSVGDMYAGALGPSLVQTLLFMLYILVISIVKPQWVPALPKSARILRGWALAKRLLWGMVPSIALIFLVLGTIFLGLATPTEAGAP